MTSRRQRHPALFRAAGLALGWALLAPSPAAHDGHDGRLARADERLAEAPEDAAAWLARAQLHRQAGSLDAACRDLIRAADLQAPTRPLVLEQVQLADALGATAWADHRLAGHLIEDPDDGRAWALASERALGEDRPEAAARAGLRAWTLLEPPTPEQTLVASQACRAAGRIAAGEALLQRAVQRLGPVPALVREQIAWARARGDLPAALVHLEQVHPRDELWWLRRGELLAAAGRSAEARQAYRQASDLLAQRSPRRRGSPAGRELARRLTALLAEAPDTLEGGPGLPAPDDAPARRDDAPVLPDDPALP